MAINSHKIEEKRVRNSREEAWQICDQETSELGEKRKKKKRKKGEKKRERKNRKKIEFVSFFFLGLSKLEVCNFLYFFVIDDPCCNSCISSMDFHQILDIF